MSELSTCLQEIIHYLDENLSDPVPRYILEKEIMHNSSWESKYIELKESKWYKQLSAEQWENGSWGRFHTQDTKSLVKRRFVTTEAALRRAHELSLDKNDTVVNKSIRLMERYIRGEEEWLDTNEHHYGFKVAFRALIAANLSLFDPKHPLVQTKKEICANNLSKALKNGSLDEDVWETENRKSNEILLKPYTVYIVWLLQNNVFLQSAIERNYFHYIWYRREGIYYRTNCPSSEKHFLESKNFLTWISSLDDLSDFPSFPEFMGMGTTDHLLNEIDRLMNNHVVLPQAAPIFGHYAEAWTNSNSRKNDMILRVMRILVKC